MDLILGHRVSEWCGHAPMLEEDLALSNLALDLLGQARALYAYAATVEGKGRDEDQLAFLRLERDYRNLPAGGAAQWRLRPYHVAPVLFCCLHETVLGLDRRQLNRRDAARHCRQGGQGNGLPRAPLRRVGDPAGRRHRGKFGEACGQPSRRCIATRQSCSRIAAFGLCMEAGILPARESLRPHGTRPSAWCSTKQVSSIPEIEFHAVRAVGATACMARRWATCWPSCSTCSAPIRTW
jgi:hypothetical protein